MKGMISRHLIRSVMMIIIGQVLAKCNNLKRLTLLTLILPPSTLYPKPLVSLDRGHVEVIERIKIRRELAKKRLRLPVLAKGQLSVRIL